MKFEELLELLDKHWKEHLLKIEFFIQLIEKNGLSFLQAQNLKQQLEVFGRSFIAYTLSVYNLNALTENQLPMIIFFTQAMHQELDTLTQKIDQYCQTKASASRNSFFQPQSSAVFNPIDKDLLNYSLDFEL